MAPSSSSTASSLNSSLLLTNVLSSAAAGIVGRCLTHPLDTAKARLQAAPGAAAAAARPDTGPFQVLARTLRTDGVRGWYRGFGVVVTLGTPGTVLYLSTYEVAKERLGRHASGAGGGGAPGWLVHLAGGMLAESVACVVYVPVDVVKERMQVQQRPEAPGGGSGGGSSSPYYYRSTADALAQISRTEGLRGLYRGYAATLMSFGPFSALYFVFYEKCKQLARNYEASGELVLSAPDRRAQTNTDLSFRATLVCSATAGAAASWLTSPLDLAKLRLQIARGQQHQQGGGPTYRGVLDCLQQAFRQGGVRGLFRGALARVIHFCPATTITMTSYESCRSVIAKVFHVDAS